MIMKKILSVVLALVIACGCVTVAFAQEMETDKLKVEINTDKNEYRVSDEIIFNVKVTNVSDETLEVVELDTASEDLIIIQGPVNKFVDELAPGESMEITFRTRALFNSKKLSFLEKITAFICSISHFGSVWYGLARLWTLFAFNPNCDYGIVDNKIPVKVGDSELILRVRASYCIGGII